MAIDFTGRQVEISADLRRYTQERLKKLVRLVGEEYDLHVILTAEKHRRTAEFTLKFRQHTVVGIHETADIRTAINGAVDKLASQTVRLLERRRTKRRRMETVSEKAGVLRRVVVHPGADVPMRMGRSGVGGGSHRS